MRVGTKWSKIYLGIHFLLCKLRLLNPYFLSYDFFYLLFFWGSIERISREIELGVSNRSLTQGCDSFFTVVTLKAATKGAQLSIHDINRVIQGVRAYNNIKKHWFILGLLSWFINPVTLFYLDGLNTSYQEYFTPSY